MNKLDLPDSPNEVVNFIVAFGQLFDHILADFQRKQYAYTQMVPKEDERSKAWNLANESNQYAEKLEKSLRQEDEVVTVLNAKTI